MAPTVVRIDARRIVDRESFHDVFAEAFGFFDGYGRNMDAWIDCLSDLDLTRTDLSPDGVVALQIDHVEDFADRCPDLYDDLIECAAFVNWRLVDRGHAPTLALAFDKPRHRLKTSSPQR